MSDERFSSSPVLDPLPPGTRVSFLLIEKEPELNYELTSSLRGRRAVSGEVVGYAVRSRKAVDLQIRKVLTWTPDTPPRDWEAMPEGFSMTVRVRIELTLARTFELLTNPGKSGRAVLCVTEIPWGRCWKCQAPAGKGVRCCTECGSPLGIGKIEPRAGRHPESFEESCRGCWGPLQGGGNYCPSCGHARSLDSLDEKLEDRRVAVRLLFVQPGRKRVPYRGFLLGLRAERLFAEGQEQLLARVGELSPEGDALADLPSGFATEVVVHADGGRVSAAARSLLQGGQMRVSEYKRPCPRCVLEVGEHARLVRGKFCTRCGYRARLFAHVSDAEYSPGRREQFERLHDCGASYRLGKDSFCGACGEDVAAERKEEARFALLG